MIEIVESLRIWICARTIFDWFGISSFLILFAFVIILFLRNKEVFTLDNFLMFFYTIQTTCIIIITIVVAIFLITYPNTILNYTSGDAGGLEQFVQIVFTFIALVGAILGFFIKELGVKIKDIPKNVDSTIKTYEKHFNKVSEEKIKEFETEMKIKFETEMKEYSQKINNMAEKLGSYALSETKEKFEELRDIVKENITVLDNDISKIVSVYAEFDNYYKDNNCSENERFTSLLYKFKIMSLFGVIIAKKCSEKIRADIKAFVYKNPLTENDLINLNSFKIKGRRLDAKEKENINKILKYSDVKEISFNKNKEIENE